MKYTTSLYGMHFNTLHVNMLSVEEIEQYLAGVDIHEKNKYYSRFVSLLESNNPEGMIELFEDSRLFEHFLASGLSLSDLCVFRNKQTNEFDFDVEVRLENSKLSINDIMNTYKIKPTIVERHLHQSKAIEKLGNRAIEISQIERNKGFMDYTLDIDGKVTLADTIVDVDTYETPFGDMGFVSVYFTVDGRNYYFDNGIAKMDLLETKRKVRIFSA